MLSEINEGGWLELSRDERIVITMDTERFNGLKELADKKNLSIPMYCRMVLSEYLAKIAEE